MRVYYASTTPDRVRHTEIYFTMTYGCQTWSLNEQLTNKLRTAQRAVERKMLGLKLQDRIPCSEIRKRTKIIAILQNTH